MQDVSGISGAAPAWLDLMLALHADRPSVAPAPPAGRRCPRRRLRACDRAAAAKLFSARHRADGGRGQDSGTTHGAYRQSAERRHHRRRSGHTAAVPDSVRAQPRHGRGGPSRSRRDALGNATGAKAWAPRPGTHRLELRAGDGRCWMPLPSGARTALASRYHLRARAGTMQPDARVYGPRGAYVAPA